MSLAALCVFGASHVACATAQPVDEPVEEVSEEWKAPEVPSLEEAQARHEASPDDPMVRLELARALIAQDTPQYRKAQPHAEYAFTSGRDDALAGRVLGKIYWEVGQPIDTVRVWAAARAAYPDAVRDSDYGYALHTALTTARMFKDFRTSIELRRTLRSLHHRAPEAFDWFEGQERSAFLDSLSRDEDINDRSSMARYHSGKGEYRRAKRVWLELAGDFPESVVYPCEAAAEFIRSDESLGKGEPIEACLERFEGRDAIERVRRLQVVTAGGSRERRERVDAMLTEKLSGYTGAPAEP